jgi:hypothetical protein
MLAPLFACSRQHLMFGSSLYFVPALHAQLVAYEGFASYAANSQIESGANGASGSGLDGGAGWAGPYDVKNSIKSLVRVENRTSSPVNYNSGEIALSGGFRALRFYDSADGSFALQRPLGTTFSAAAGESLWFSILFRTATGGASPLTNQDFFQIGFDDNANAESGNPRVSIGANTIQTTYPAPGRFFARSSTNVSASDFHDDVDIAAATTYLLVACIQPNTGTYDTVKLFVNPTGADEPGPPAASVVQPSGIHFLSHAFIRTAYLDSGDAYVIDEWHIGRDYRSVIQSLNGALRLRPAGLPDHSILLRWPVAPSTLKLETSTTLAPGSWTEIAGPFSIDQAEWTLSIPLVPGEPGRFFRLRR